MTRIEEATLDDIPAMVALLDCLFAQEAEFRPDPAAEARGLALILKNPAAGRLFVLREEDRVTGMANLLFSVSTALGEKVAILEDVIVAPDRRECGLGRRLLAEVLDRARKLGCARVTLLTDADNRIAQEFYASLGFFKSPMQPMRLVFPRGV